MKNWRLNIDSWPGPNRKKWPGLQDIIQESPEGRYVAVVYSCGEIGISKEVGRFALLCGSPDSPRLLLRPRGLTCFVWYNDTTVQWIGEHVCAVTPYWTRMRINGTFRAYSGALYLNAKQHRAAYVPDASTSGIIAQLPDDLVWRSWQRLRLWPLLWPGI